MKRTLLGTLLFTALTSFANVSATNQNDSLAPHDGTFRQPIEQIHQIVNNNTRPLSSFQDSFFSSVYVNSLPPLPYSYRMTGDWNGYRHKIADAGIQIDWSYSNNLLGNPVGGVKQGFAYTDSTGLNLLFDLQKLIKLQNWSLLVALVQRNGKSLTTHYIGNLFSVSQLYGGENFRLDTLYFKKNMMNDRLQLSFGRLNAGDYFLQSPLYYAYVSNAYCGNPIAIFFNAPLSAYPNAQWGAYLYGRPSDIIASKFAVFNTNTSVNENRFHGTNFSFNGNNGVMLIAELDLLNNKQVCWFGCNHPGRYNLGFVYYTGKGQEDQFTGNKVQGNYAFYYQIEQKLYQPGFNALRGLSSFFVMELFPENYNKIPFYYEMGMIYRGLSAHRPRDFMALGFAYGRFSHRLQHKQQVEQQELQHYEASVELNYRVFVTRWFFVQPDIQYVIKPNGYNSLPSAWVFGAQMSVQF